MVSKVREQIYVEVAASLLGVDWQLIEIPEPLDFEIRTETEIFGLEVRQVFTDQEERYGSPAKRVEAENQRIISMLADLYYERGGQPVVAKFLGPIHASNAEALVERMLATPPSYPNGREVLEVQGVKAYLTALPPSHPNYRHWFYVDDHVGWLRNATSHELQRAVDRKAANLQLYLQKYSTVDLLLVADRTFNSGGMKATDELMVCNPGFRAIYFLSHPEAVIRVG